MKIGIIGGCGPLASSLAYQHLVELLYEKKKLLQEIIVLNYPFQRGSRELTKELESCFFQLKKVQVDTVLLACNTLHALLPQVNVADIRVVSIPEVVSEKKGANALLLGTYKTRDAKLYPNCLKLVDEEQELLEEVIDQVLEGVITAKEHQTILNILESSYQRGPFKEVILGCTDLSVIHQKYPIRFKQVVVLDSLKLGVEAICHCVF